MSIEFLWIPTRFPGFPQDFYKVSIDFYWIPWISCRVKLHRILKIFNGSHGFSPGSLDFHGISWFYLKIQWISNGFHKFPRTSLIHGFPKTSMNFYRISWISIGFYGLLIINIGAKPEFFFSNNFL